MSSDGSVTGWIDLVKIGESAAAQQLWERYFRRLVGLARARIDGFPRRVQDEEDVALSAFDSFCRSAERGRFPQLADRDDLWRVLMTITTRKAAHMMRDEGRQKRGGGAVIESAGGAGEGGGEPFLSREPTPDFAAQVAEEYQRLLKALDDPELELVAVRKMEGFTVEEIAAELRCAPRSVKRKLQLIRTIWAPEIEA